MQLSVTTHAADGLWDMVNSATAPMSTILIIEDDSDLVMIISAALRLSGYEVHTAANGKEGLRLIKQYSFDLVLCDVLMPEADGLEFISSIRKAKEPIPIVAMSGGGLFGGEKLLTMASLLGADAVLQKPFSFADLREVVTRLLDGTTRVAADVQA